MSDAVALRLHHVGYVVADIDAAMPAFVRSLGAVWDGTIFADPHQKVRVAFLSPAGGEAQIELVAPDAPDAPVMRFLTEKGGGMHHLCYEVEELDHALEVMRRRGAVIAKRPKPATAFEGRPIAWILTREKLLIELLEAERPRA